MKILKFSLFLFLSVSLLYSQSIDYPESKKVNQVDHYFGTKVKDPSTYAVVFRDEVYIHLCDQNGLDYQIGGPGAVFIAITGIDELWHRVKNSESMIMVALCDMDFGHGVRFHIFTIKDPDDNVLRIGEQIE
jgi:hypothetical protein